jgi:hypothetical protein
VHEKERSVKLEKMMAGSRLPSLRCMATGHRWAQESDIERTNPVLVCRRCGRVRELHLAGETMSGLAEREGRRGAELGGLAPTRFRR